MDAKNKQIKPQPVTEGLPGRVLRSNMPPITLKRFNEQADGPTGLRAVPNMTPEQEAKARHVGPEAVESIKETRERRERGIKTRRERGEA